MYEYAARVVRWIDGDTIVVDIDQGFHDWKTDQHLRLIGIDAPDKQPLKGRATTQARIYAPDGANVIIRTHKDVGDKYGRWLAEVYAADDPAYPSVNEMLVAAGLARPWNGTGAHPWDAA